MARDVLDRDDRIVHQQAERDDETCDGQLIQRIAEEVQHDDAEGQRQRDRDHHDARGAPAERQQRQHHERDGDAEVHVEAVQPCLDVLRLVETLFQRDPFRQRRGVEFHGVVDALLDLDDVEAVLHVRRDEHRTLAVVAADVRQLLRIPAYGGDVANPHAASVDRRHDGVTDLVEVRVGARSLQAEAARAEIDRAGRDVGVVALYGLDDLRGGQPQLGHPLEVHFDAQFAARVRPGLGGQDAVDAFQGVFEVARVILEFAIGRILGHQRELHDVDEARAELADDQFADFDGQRGTQCVDLAGDLVVLLLRIGEGLELDGREREAVDDRRFHLAHVVELREAVLHRLDDQALEILGVCAGHDRRDAEAGDLERRIFLARHLAEREPAECDEAEENDQRELIAADRKFEHGHAAALSPGSPSHAGCSAASPRRRPVPSRSGSVRCLRGTARHR